MGRVYIAASAGYRWGRSACVEKQRRWVGNGCVRGDNSSGCNREEETVVVGLLSQMIDWCRKREGAPLS